LRPPLVSFDLFVNSETDADYVADDIKDIYRRAEGQELVVEGLREGANFNVEE
jgi:hypothetical protein